MPLTIELLHAQLQALRDMAYAIEMSTTDHEESDLAMDVRVQLDEVIASCVPATE